MKPNRKRKALISVSDKENVGVLGLALEAAGWEIYASTGTCDALKAAGVKAPIDVVDIGVPTMLGHLVATLHPNIHAAVLREDTPEHDAEMESMPVDMFDLVYCIPYDFETAYVKAADAGRNPERAELVRRAEDVGAMSLIQGASKAGRIILHSKDQIPEAVNMIESGKDLSGEWLAKLAADARYFLGDYLDLIAKFDRERVDGMWKE